MVLLTFFMCSVYVASCNLIFCVPGLIQGWGYKVSLRFHLFVYDVIQGGGDFGYKKVGSRFSCVAPRMERDVWNL